MSCLRSISARLGLFQLNCDAKCACFEADPKLTRKRFTELLIGSNVESF